MPSLESKFKKILTQDQDFKTTLAVIIKVSVGQIWLIGGAVYKRLLTSIHGKELLVGDYDFIVENVKEPLPKLDDWTFSYNSFENPRFSNKKGLVIDLVPLNNICELKKRGWKPSILNYLQKVPFSVQAVAFNIKTGKLIGAGLADIKNGVIRINDEPSYNYIVAQHGEKVDLNHMAKKLKLNIV